MSMFGAVDLSSLAPKQGAASAAASADAGPTTGRMGGLVVDVDAQNLREVAEGSSRVPVVVVLHTSRSQASTDLASVLERLAGEYAGRFQLARVDVDAAPEVAQALQATAVPTVVALIAGQPVPMFQGGIPEEQLRPLLDQLLEVAARNGVDGRIAVESAEPSAPDEPEETEVERQAREAIERGDWAGAEAVYDRAIANSPADDELKAARDQVRLLARMDGQDPTALLATADAPGADLDAQLAGADAALALGDVNACLGRALEAVRAHAGEEREHARLRLLELFAVIGATSPEVARARRQLATILY
ncbi:tetratricopeptide repeat protein [Actinomyces sp.]|uniref:tetratricopeptide repeat protein n=1 Tax=Actinomyces sp. TaxID=29317 RepID=UPI0026DBAFCA|nr:tetratricopeptide repeat protein [Actinomyces sp.]MDO4899784.1 tetratricopeptide repeat protein [Actinomyces sp.]